MSHKKALRGSGWTRFTNDLRPLIHDLHLHRLLALDRSARSSRESSAHQWSRPRDYPHYQPLFRCVSCCVTIPVMLCNFCSFLFVRQWFIGTTDCLSSFHDILCFSSRHSLELERTISLLFCLSCLPVNLLLFLKFGFTWEGWHILCVLFSVWMVVSKPAEHSTCRCVVSSLGFSSCDPVYSSRTELNEQWKHSNESSSFVPRM
jgi:hypothetical protein